MFVPNFSSLAGLEVAEKFGVVVVRNTWLVATMSNLKEVSLFLWVESSYIGTFLSKYSKQITNDYIYPTSHSLAIVNKHMHVKESTETSC